MSLMCAYGQSLHDVTLDLNSGGEVYDVAFDDSRNLYIIVGDFTSVQGQLRNNFALIDASTLQVTNENPITSINGIIRTVDYIHYVAPFPQFQQYDYIYIGGDFTSINGNNNGNWSQSYIARLSFATGSLNSSSYSVNNFDPDNYFTNMGQYPGVGVNDLILKGDTLLVVGAIVYENASIYQSGIIGFSTLSGSAASTHLPNLFLDYDGYPQSGCNDVSPGAHWNIRDFNNMFYLNGNVTFDYSGNELGTPFESCGNETCNMYDMEVHRSSEDTVFIGYIRYAAGSGIVIYDINGILLNCPFENTLPIILDGSAGFIETHNDFVYVANQNEINAYERNSTNEIVASNVFNCNNSWRGDLFDDVWNPQKIKRIRNKLFLSSSQLTSIDGQARNGLAVICLEPGDPSFFNNFDTLICEGESSIYTIPPVEYAEGYRWTYTGTGALYRIANSGNAFQPLSTVIIPSLSGIEVKYPTGATSGVLSVEPYSTCNTATDYLFSKPLTLNITFTPLPDLTIPENTMYFTCNESDIDLIAQSSTAGVSWEWVNNSFIVGTSDMVSININDGVIDGSFFNITLTEPIYSCQSFGAIQLVYDTLATPVVVSSIVQSPSVFDCAADSVYMTNTTPNATVNWALNSDPDNLLSDFIIYDANDSLDVICYLTYAANGCTAQQGFTIDSDAEILVAEVLGYTGLLTDTLDCNNPNLSLECALNPSSANGTVDWIINGAVAGATLNLSAADTAGMTSGAQTYTYTSTNLDNGCTADFSAVVSFDFEEPFVVPYNGPSSINCSASDLELIHDLSGGNVQEGWLDASGVNTNNNSLFVNTIGNYVYEVLSLDNGCSVNDTVEILLTTELLLDLQEDILLCDGQTGSITVTPINNTETTTYTWSNGQAGQTIDVLGGTDVLVSVIAENSSGCIGYDTITVNTSSAIQAVLEASSGCTGGAVQVLSVSGGTGSYSYSMDALTWQQDPVFSGLTFGDQTIYIQDDLGCVYSFMATIDANTASFDMNFLASTYNAQGDTIAIVNVSNYTGFDSVGWVLPVGAILHSIDDSMVVMSMDVAGWYDVTMLGYQDTCSYSFTNPVYFGDYTPVFDENYEQMGITSVNIYPIPISGSSTFTVDLELGISQNYVVVVTNYLGQPIPGMSQSGVGQSMSLDFTLPGVSPGNYLVHMIADYDAQQQTIVVQ